MRPSRGGGPGVEDHVRVAVRVRPMSGSEKARGSVECVEADKAAHTVGIVAGDAQRRGFTFDYAFGSESTHDDVRPLLSAA